MDFKTRDTDELFWRLSLVLLLLLAICQLWLGWQRSPSSDDALFLSVPKNWLNGYGWATSYSEKIPFNPDFTGPTALLIPAALLIKLFGNQLWIAGVTGAFINLVLLTLCLQQLRAYWRHSGLASLFLVCGCIISKPDDFASMVGYYSGSLLFLLATLLAFNKQLPATKRALLLGTLTAIGLHIKLLLMPAFVLLFVMFLTMMLISKAIRFRQIYRLMLIATLPVLTLYGGWHLYKQHILSGYSEAYVSEYKEYGLDFFRYHGSGVGQWQDAAEKTPYLLRNTDKNLYFVEEALYEYHIRNPFIGTAPADENHIIGWILIAALLLFIVALCFCIKRRGNDAAWTMLTLSIVVLVYTFWFVIFSMAMSPGHFYFQLQWILWLTLLTISQINFRKQQLLHYASAMLIVVFTGFMITTPNQLNNYNLFSHAGIQKTDSLLTATDYIQKNQFDSVLAGCGYSGYPRHIEYLMSGSQNFSDCLDLIEDHVEMVDGRYRWKSPLAFTLVYSLQSAGSSPATSMVSQQCKDNILYRGHDVFIASCNFKDLQKIDLANLMPEIRKTHRWYRTRIKP